MDRGLRSRLAGAGRRRGGGALHRRRRVPRAPAARAARGRAAIHAYWSGATSKQADLDLLFGTPIVAGERAAVEWWAQMSSDGEEVTMPGILFLRFAPDGRCTELREAWNAEEGRTSPPDGWGL